MDFPEDAHAIGSRGIQIFSLGPLLYFFFKNSLKELACYHVDEDEMGKRRGFSFYCLTLTSVTEKRYLRRNISIQKIRLL